MRKFIVTVNGSEYEVLVEEITDKDNADTNKPSIDDKNDNSRK